MSFHRQSRRVKFTTDFVDRVIKGEIAGEWQDSESPLRIKGTRTGAQYRVRKKVAGRVVAVSPRDAFGTVVANAARYWTLWQARQWARKVTMDLIDGVEPFTGKKMAASTTPAELVPDPIPVGRDPAFVYFLFKAGACVYVGQTRRQPSKRIDAHRNSGREFDAYSYVAVDPETVDATEARWIFTLRPKGNRMVRLIHTAGSLLPGGASASCSAQVSATTKR